MKSDSNQIQKILTTNWKVIPFQQAIQDRTGGNPKIKKSEYREQGRLAIIDQGEKLIGGYTDDQSLACKENLPCILFGDHTKEFKFINEPFALGADGLKVLSPLDGFDKRFIFYFLKTIKLPKGLGYSRHYKFLKEANIVMPPIQEQKRIAAILDKAEAIRRKREEAIKLADDFLRSVFLDMFGDPVTNPKGWAVLNFGDVGTSRLGKMLDKGREVGDCQYPYLANFNVQWGRFNLDNLRCMDFSEEDRKEFELREGDLLICEGGEVGRTAIWRNELNSVFFQKALHRVRLDLSITNPEYVQSYMLFMAKNGGFGDFTNSATIAHLTGVKLKMLPIPIPPLNIQKNFSKIFKSIERQKILLNSQLVSQNMLFGSLQQRAFKGEL